MGLFAPGEGALTAEPPGERRRRGGRAGECQHGIEAEIRDAPPGQFVRVDLAEFADVLGQRAGRGAVLGEVRRDPILTTQRAAFHEQLQVRPLG